MDASSLLQRFASAKAKRSVWESHWQECYDYALPHGGGFNRGGNPGERKTDRLFDGTAADAVKQLSASLLAQLTPPWSRWFGLMPGPDLSDADRDAVAPVLERAAATLQSHFDRSNFAVEMHQCYLDLVTAGTACLLFEEAAPGDFSSFRFTAVPLAEAVLEEGADGRLDGTFRRAGDGAGGGAGPASPVRRGRGRPEGRAGLPLHRDPGQRDRRSGGAGRGALRPLALHQLPLAEGLVTQVYHMNL
jgi:hypothetical protein